MAAAWSPARGTLIYINRSPHAGKEMPGTHPLLVASSDAFNQTTGIVIGFPMTHAAFNASNPFAVAVEGPKGELAYVLAFQPKSFDWRARNATPHPWKGPHDKVLAAALAMLDAICDVCTRT